RRGTNRTRRGRRHIGSIGTTDGARTETAGRCGRGVAKKTADGVEDVTPGKEATEDLVVKRVQPFAANLDRVIPGNERKIVLHMSSPEKFINVRLQKEWIAEPERRDEAHGCVRRDVRWNCSSWTQLARVRKVGLVQLGRRNSAEQVHVEVVD